MKNLQPFFQTALTSFFFQNSAQSPHHNRAVNVTSADHIVVASGDANRDHASLVSLQFDELASLTKHWILVHPDGAVSETGD